VHNRILALAALGGLVALPACTSGQAAVEPRFTPANVSTSQLQFQVGTANLQGSAGLNTVVTFRQPNGLSALLDNTPSITLPFINTAAAAAAFNDSGASQITGTVQTNNGAASTDPRTFGQGVGAFAYGFLNSNSATTGANNSAFYPAANSMPYYGAVHAPVITARAFYVGPGNAFVPNFKDGSLGTAFSGYPNGFTSFAIAPTVGTYTLSVGLPNASTPIPTFTATTTMTSITMLPAMPPPVVTSTGAGGLNVSETIPAGILETLIFIVDRNTGNFYTLVMRGTGLQTATLANNLGPITGGVAGPSLNPGDLFRAYAIGFDYLAIEAVPVGANPPQAPAINNTATPCTFSGVTSTCPGQADLTQSPATNGAE
jgi:hypothetical protein